MKRAFVITALGIGGGQALVLLVTPFLARIYSPADFGVYATVMAIASVVAAISALRFDASIPAAADEDVRLLLQAGIILPLVVCPLALFSLKATIDFTGWGRNLLDEVPIQSVLFVALFQGMVAVLLAYCTRAAWFGRSALIRLIQASGFAIFAIFAFGSLEFALAFGWIIALFFGLVVCGSAFSINSEGMFGAIRRTWRFPIMSVPMTLLDSMAVALPVMLLVDTFGSADAGAYTQVQRLIGAPLILCGLAVAQVFYKNAGDRYRNREPITSLFWGVVVGLSILGLAMLVFSVIAGEFAMGLLLGQGWRVDTWFITLTLIPVIARVVVSPVSSVFLIANRIGMLSTWQVLYFMVTLLVLLIAKGKLDFDRFILAFACSECFMYGVYLFLATRVVRQAQSRVLV